MSTQGTQGDHKNTPSDPHGGWFRKPGTIFLHDLGRALPPKSMDELSDWERAYHTEEMQTAPVAEETQDTQEKAAADRPRCKACGFFAEFSRQPFCPPGFHTEDGQDGRENTGDWAGRGFTGSGEPTDAQVLKYIEGNPQWFENWVKSYDRIHGTKGMRRQR